MSGANTAFSELRAVERDEVHYRARAFGPKGDPITLLIVNLSPMGLMARCHHEMPAGQAMRLTLPGIGTVDAIVRWSLGGRLGAEFVHQLDRVTYYNMLGDLMRKD